MMEQLAESNPVELVDGPQGMVRWASNDAYAQAHGNKPKYVGRIRSVSKNIPLVRGNIHSYYTQSQARSYNAPPSAVIFEMIENALQAKREQHKQKIDELLAKQREEHKQQMDAMTAAITTQFATQMAAYEARFRTLEGSKVVTSKPEVTNERALHDLGSPTHLIIRSFVDSTQDNNILFFIII